MTWPAAGDCLHPIAPPSQATLIVQTSFLRSVHTSALHHSVFTLHRITHSPPLFICLSQILLAFNFSFQIPYSPSLPSVFTTCLPISGFLFPSSLSLSIKEIPVMFSVTAVLFVDLPSLLQT